MPRAPKKTPQAEPQGPTTEEVAALYRLRFDSQLFSAHGIIVQNVESGVYDVLKTLGRPDLAAIWADRDALLNHSTRGTSSPSGSGLERPPAGEPPLQYV